MEHATNSSVKVDLLFRGQSFWVSRSVPQRNRFIDIIEANGGTVEALEHQADIKLVDHTRKDNPPGTYSYQYIEKSARNGKLENLEDHRTGPGGARFSDRVRSSDTSKSLPRKGKIVYTLADDQALWDWMKPYEEDGQGGGARLPFRDLELVNPRHTAESWRNRWTKHLRGLPRPGGPPQDNGPEVITSARLDTEAISPRAEYHIPDSVSGRRRTTKEDTRRVESPYIRRPGGSGHVNRHIISEPEESIDGSDSMSPSRRVEKQIVLNISPAKHALFNRKRASSYEFFNGPSFDMNYDEESQKRRATDFGPPRHPSTPRRHYSREETTKSKLSQRAIVDATDSEVSESISQIQNTQDHLLRQKSILHSTIEDEDLNLKALLELPFLAATPELEEGPSSVQVASSRSDAQSIDEWIELRLHSRKGIDERQIIQALRGTSMDPILADTVLGILSSGKEIPQHMRGVWTPEDDACVEGTDARNIDRVLKKHGTELYNARFEYLQMVRSIKK